MGYLEIFAKNAKNKTYGGGVGGWDNGVSVGKWNGVLDNAGAGNVWLLNVLVLESLVSSNVLVGRLAGVKKVGSSNGGHHLGGRDGGNNGQKDGSENSVHFEIFSFWRQKSRKIYFNRE